MTAAAECNQENQGEHQVRTEVLTLETVGARHMGFVIPSYQRPYVWRDEDVIKAADEAGLAMVFTGMRHFRH